VRLNYCANPFHFFLLFYYYQLLAAFEALHPKRFSQGFTSMFADSFALSLNTGGSSSSSSSSSNQGPATPKKSTLPALPTLPSTASLSQFTPKFIPGTPASSSFSSSSSVSFLFPSLFNNLSLSLFRHSESVTKIQNFIKDLDPKKAPPPKKSPWVPKSLNDVIRQNKLVIYFMDFLDLHGATPCLRFWLTVESYRNLNFLENKDQNLLDDVTSIHTR